MHEDELISRVVDGDATAEERATVARDPRLRARVEDVERVQAALRDVEPPSAEAVDTAIAAALLASTSTGAATEAAPVSLAHQRDRRRRRTATILAVAAALLIGVPLLAIAFTGRGTESADMASTAVESNTGATDEPVAAGAAPDAVPDLGALDSDDQLREALGPVAAASNEQQLGSAAESSTHDTTDAAAARAYADATADCGTTQLELQPTLGSITYRAVATWLGEPSTIIVYQADPGVIFVLAADCSVLARVAR